MGTLAFCGHYTLLSWKHIAVAFLLVHLCCLQVQASCRILKCNSDFVTATGGGASKEGGANAGYCSALRSFAVCTRRTARACRGDLGYHSAVQGIEDLLIQHSCPRAGPTAQPRPPPQAPISGDACLYEKGYLQREGRAPEYVHCGVFGDPHVRTFNDEFQTCAVRGAWPLIDNEFLYVQATSAPMNGGHATALTKITVIFKNWRQCIEQQIYQAELDDIPAAFVDGSVSSGERRGQHSLSVRSQDPGRHAEIHAAHIATVLVVRQSGRSLGVSVRSPRAIAQAFAPEQDLQLCMWGCPASQRLKTTPPHPSYTPLSSSTSTQPSPVSARAHCAALLPAKDVYYQACLFDLLATGDLNATMAAVTALEDARSLITDPDKVHLLPATSAVGRLTASLPTVLVLAVALLSEWAARLWFGSAVLL